MLNVNKEKIMEDKNICPNCERVIEREDIYCDNCGIHIRKYHNSEYDREFIEPKYKDKKGSFEKNFFRGKNK